MSDVAGKLGNHDGTVGCRLQSILIHTEASFKAPITPSAVMVAYIRLWFNFHYTLPY